MTDTANPETGATGVEAGPDGLSYEQAASLLEGALDREEAAQEALRDDKGRFVSKAGEPEPDEPEPEPADEAETDEAEEADESDEGTEAAEETEETEEETNFSSVLELAEALEMSPEDFMAQIKVPVKVDGVEQLVTLAEARDGFQMQSAFTKRTQELSEQRKAFEAERESYQEQMQTALQQTQALGQAMEQQLVADYQRVNWDELRLTDPAEFAAKRQEFAERVQGIEVMKQQAGQQFAQQQEAQTAEQHKQMQVHLQKEAEALMAAIPEWSDPDKAKHEKAELREYMKAQGFSDDEMSQLYDHRAVVMLRKAMLYDAGEKTKNVAKKKVSKLPKLVKKGAKPNPKESARRAKNSKFEALKKSGKVDDAAALFFDLDL